MNKGFEIFEQNLQAQLSASPVAQEHLGEIQSVKMDFWAGVKHSEEHGGKQAFLFRVVGSKASGEVVGDQPPPGGQSILDPVLIVNGQEIDLDF
jgi:hypothetical protein